jgi:phosphopentomutase
LAYHHNIKSVNLGERSTFADLGQTLAEMFALEKMDYGQSFYQALNAVK